MELSWALLLGIILCPAIACAWDEELALGGKSCRSVKITTPPEGGVATDAKVKPYSTVTDFARFRGLSTSVPRASAV
jgi:hypothetical protein